MTVTGTCFGQKIYGGSGADSARFAQQTPDGGFIVLGNTNSTGAGLADLAVLKLDANGTIVWQKIYGGVNDDKVDASPGLDTGQVTSDGSFIIAATTNSFGAGGHDIWLLRLDGNGGIVWQKTYGSRYFEYSNTVRVTSDGGLVVGSRGGMVLRLDSKAALPSRCTIGQASTAVSANSTLIQNGISTLTVSTVSTAIMTTPTIGD